MREGRISEAVRIIFWFKSCRDGDLAICLGTSNCNSIRSREDEIFTIDEAWVAISEQVYKRVEDVNGLQSISLESFVVWVLRGSKTHLEVVYKPSSVHTNIVIKNWPDNQLTRWMSVTLLICNTHCGSPAYRIHIRREPWQRGFIRLLQNAILGRDKFPCEWVRNWNHSDRAVYGSGDIGGIKCANWIRRRFNNGWGWKWSRRNRDGGDCTQQTRNMESKEKHFETKLLRGKIWRNFEK